MKIQDFGNVSFEQISEVPECWIARGHPDSDGFGSAYDWSFVIIKEGCKGIIKGLVSDNKITSSDTKTIRKFCYEIGINQVEFTRIRERGETEHRLK